MSTTQTMIPKDLLPIIGQYCQQDVFKLTIPGKYDGSTYPPRYALDTILYFSTNDLAYICAKIIDMEYIIKAIFRYLGSKWSGRIFINLIQRDCDADDYFDFNNCTVTLEQLHEMIRIMLGDRQGNHASLCKLEIL